MCEDGTGVTIVSVQTRTLMFTLPFSFEGLADRVLADKMSVPFLKSLNRSWLIRDGYISCQFGIET